MQKKNLSATYSKKVDLAQVIEDIQQEVPQQQQKPVSAGGATQGGMPATLSQEHLQFVDGIDEVPIWLQQVAWALVTRMNQLTYIDSDFDFERIQCGVRAQLRPLVWKRKLTILDMQGIEYFVGIQLRKSKSGRERKYIVPGYQQITHQELSPSQSVIDDQPRNNAAMGLLNRAPARHRGDR